MEPVGVGAGDVLMPVEGAASSSSSNPLAHLHPALACMANSSQTEIKVEHVKHEWTVKNFSHCYQEYLENFVHLPRVTAMNEENLTWSIKIYPKGNGENNKDFVFLCLNRVVPNNKVLSKIGFKSRFSLKSAENKEIEMRIHPNPSHSDYVSYIKRDVLFPQILPRDSITVSVEIDVATETVTTTNDPITPQLRPAQTEKQLADDFLRLFREDILTDFVIECGGRRIHCHRAVLAARSSVFNAMLTHTDTSEAKTGVLTITDMDADVVAEMLNYIYSSRCTKDVADIAADLLIAADKYGLGELKQHCENCLIEQISVENACQLLVVADMYQAHRLRQYTLIYIMQRPKAVSSTCGWSDILKSHSHLATDIITAFDKNTAASNAHNSPCSSVASIQDEPMIS